MRVALVEAERVLGKRRWGEGGMLIRRWVASTGVLRRAARRVEMRILLCGLRGRWRVGWRRWLSSEVS